jgi:hypothetical protein
MFWRCVESGEPPRLFGIEQQKPGIEAMVPLPAKITARVIQLFSVAGPPAWRCWGGPPFLKVRHVCPTH